MFSLWPKAPLPELHSTRLLLRMPKRSDFAPWRNVREASRKELEPFEPKWSAQEHSRRNFMNRMQFSHRQARKGSDYAFFIFLKDEKKPRIVGGITLSSIKMAVSRHGNLGYWVASPYTSKGIMSEAVGLVVAFGFDQLNLNRIHAAFMPHNQASKRVLQKNGFKEEGFADQYLRIAGEWEDHVLCGLTRSDWRATTR